MISGTCEERFSMRIRTNILLRHLFSFCSSGAEGSRPSCRLVTPVRVKQFLKRHIPTLLLLLILSAAFWVRVGGIWFGLPYAHHWDEPNVIHNVFRMMKTADFHPHRFFHASGYIYLQLPVAFLHYVYLANQGILTSLEEIKTAWDTGWYWTISHPSFYVWARALTVILGTGTIFLLYKIGSKIYGKKVGLLGALFLAFAFGHVEHSRPITSDVPVTFFGTFAILAAVNLVLTGKKKWYVLAGLLAGYATATKYNNLLVLAALLAAHLLNQHKKRIFNKYLLIGASCLLAGFLIGSPYSILDPKEFVKNVSYHLHFFREQQYPELYPGLTRGIVFYSKYIFSIGAGKFMAIFACLGILGGLFKKLKLNVVLLVFPVIYSLFMSNQTHRSERFAVPLIPFLALFAAVGLVYILQFISFRLPEFQKTQNLAMIGLALLVVFAPARRSIKNAYEIYHSKETRVRMTEWMKQNIPAGSKVAIIKEFHWYMPDFKDANLSVISVGALEKPSSWYSENGVDYIVTSNKFGDYYSGAVPVSKQFLTQYNTRFANASCLKQFGYNTLWLEHFSINPKVVILKAETGARAGAQEAKELIKVQTEEKAPGGKTYRWKEYRFVLDETSEVYIKLSGKTESRGVDVMAGADDDLTIELDEIVVPWNSLYSLNGAIQKGRSREVELCLANISPGEHTLILWADETPTLLSLEVTAFSVIPPEKRKQKNHGNTESH